MVLYNPSGGYLAGAEIPLATRTGRRIPNERRMQRVPSAMLAARDFVLASHRTARMRSLASVYNCMGMCFASRRTWVDPDNLATILRDDEFQRINTIDRVMEGDVVVYRNASGEVVHVGIVVKAGLVRADAQREIIVLSQWGGDGEYFHAIDDLNPRLGQPFEFWTDRHEP